LTWLLAYEHGLLDHLAPGDLAAVLPRLVARISERALTIDAPQQAWLAALRECLAEAP
jgi:hypothetical protein